MNILIFGDIFSRHTIRVAQVLLKSSKVNKVTGVTLLNNNRFYPGEKVSDLPYAHTFYLKYKAMANRNQRIKRLLYLLKVRHEIKQIIKGHDVVSIQAVTPTNSILFSHLKKPIVSSFWGGEIWENLGKTKRFFQSLLLRQSTLVTVVSETMAKKVKKEFPFISDSKLRLVRYGFLDPEILDNVTKEMLEKFKRNLGIEPREKIVTISYASAPRHRQDLVLDFLEELDKKFLEVNNIKFVLPLTYGDPEWRNYIAKKVSIHKFKKRIIVINKMLSDEQIATLRKISDIFINIPTQDTFSASMLEHLYAGSIVIVGSWLPYDELFKSNAFIVKVKEFSKKCVLAAIRESIINLNNYKKLTQRNKKIAVKIGWKGNWAEIFEEAIEIWKKNQR